MKKNKKKNKKKKLSATWRETPSGAVSAHYSFPCC